MKRKRYLIQLRSDPRLYTYEVRDLNELRAKLNVNHKDYVDILAVEDIEDE